ncbi:MAG: substrate-binding domain-containing protein, partial [bacterium]|nr:substrate-binding domain-containing protein [bacterium]
LRVRKTRHPDRGFDWSEVLSDDARPSCLVCVGAKLAAEASTRAVDAGLTAPSMLSITALPRPGETGLEEKSITTYDVAPDRVLQWATELLITAHPGEPPRTVIVPGELKDRGSAAPPASGGTIASASPAEASM